MRLVSQEYGHYHLRSVYKEVATSECYRQFRQTRWMNGMRFVSIDWPLSNLLYRPLPNPFRERRDQRADWQELFSEVEMDRVGALLRALCDAFSFSDHQRYRFAPTDTVAEVYRACYPRWKFWIIGDNLEIESLMKVLEKSFRIDGSQWHADISLGEIAAMMQPP